MSFGLSKFVKNRIFFDTQHLTALRGCQPCGYHLFAWALAPLNLKLVQVVGVTTLALGIALVLCANTWSSPFGPTVPRGSILGLTPMIELRVKSLSRRSCLSMVGLLGTGFYLVGCGGALCVRPRLMNGEYCNLPNVTIRDDWRRNIST